MSGNASQNTPPEQQQTPAHVQQAPLPGDTGTGFLVGVDPATPVVPSVNVTTDPGTPLQPMVLTDQPTQGRLFTEADLARVRQEEKDKLYSRIEQMSSQMNTLQAERDAQRQAEEEARRAADEAKRAQELAEMSAQERLAEQQRELEQRIEDLQAETERERAIREREAQLRELEQYRYNAIEAAAEYIMPELRDLIGGNSPEEIDQSIQVMIDRTNAIMAQVRGAVAPAPPSEMRGPSPTGYAPVGPMEQAQGFQPMSADDIRTMSMDDYRRHREGLMQAASRQYHGG